MPKRATQKELEERVQRVFILLRQGHMIPRIQNMLVEQEGISKKTAQRAVAAAMGLLESLGSQETRLQRGLMQARLNHLFSETSHGNHRNIDQALKVLGLQMNLLPSFRARSSNDAPPVRDTLSPELAAILQRY